MFNFFSRRAIEKSYRRHNELISEFNVGLNGLKAFYMMAFPNQNFMVTWFTNLNEGMVFWGFFFVVFLLFSLLFFFFLLPSLIARRWVGRQTLLWPRLKKVQVGKDQEKAQSEKDSHSKNRGGKKPN